MRKTLGIVLVLVFAMMMTVACTREKASVKEPVENALKTGGFDNVNVDENREQGVVTLKGDVQSEDMKTRAEMLAKGAAGTMVIKNELAVKPAGMEDRAESMMSEADTRIKDEWKRMAEAQKMDDISADVQNGVVTLKGEVKTAAMRKNAETMAAKIAGVTQVVNELNIEGQEGDTRATTTKK